MEASVAEGTQQGAGGQGQEGQAAAAPDFGPVLEQMNANFAALGEQLQGALGGGQQAADDGDEGAFEDDDLAYPEPGADGELDPEAAQEYLDNLVQQRAKGVAQQEIQEALAPVMEALTEQRIEREATDLQTKYPQLRDPEVSEAVIERATGVVQQLGLSGDAAARLVTSGSFIELVFKAGLAEQQAAGTPTDGLGLEPAGGQGPAQAEPNIARQVVDAGRPNNFWM